MNSLIKFNGDEKKLVFPEFPSLFDDFITKDFFKLPTRELLNANRVPPVNIKETDSAFELELAVPGMDKKNFKITLDQNMLVISTQQENKTEETSNDGKYSRKEFSYQSFTREFQLPDDSVIEDNINASYKDGILNITVPKKESAKPRLLKQIAVA